LAPDFTGVAVEPIEPDPPPEQFGARVDFGRPGQRERRAAERLRVRRLGSKPGTPRALESTPSPDGRTVRAIANGALLLVGVANSDQPAGVAVLDHLASAFAGME
jgi:hypothetical protein